MATSTMDALLQAYADLDLIPFLYNTCYGGYAFTDEFMERLNERRVAAGLEPYQSSYSISYGTRHRYDPMITGLFQEMGSVNVCEPYSKIAIEWIPKEFIERAEINEYDGKECVNVNIQEIYSEILKEFLKEWASNGNLRVEELNRRYERVKSMAFRYREFQRERMELRRVK